jgi:cytoskeletal protein RodZ
MNFLRNYILNIFIAVIIIFALIIFIDVSNINLNPEHSNKKVVQVVNIEALKNKKKSKKSKKSKKNDTTTNETNETTKKNDTTTNKTDETDETNQIVPPPEPNKPNTSINMSPVDDFCKSNSASLKESCAKLTKKNCNSTTCCVVLNGKKCVAGNQDGPTFKTESGKDISIDYYYYQNKCYGNSCPTK